MYGDKAYGGGVASNGDSNYGNAVYKLVNLNDQSLYLQNLGMYTELGKLTDFAIGQSAQIGAAIKKQNSPDKKFKDFAIGQAALLGGAIKNNLKTPEQKFKEALGGAI